MKSIAKYLLWLFLPAACLLLWWVCYNQPVTIRSPYQTQLQLIRAGHGKAWVKGEWKVLKADGEWGPISQAAHNQYLCDKVMRKMKGN